MQYCEKLANQEDPSETWALISSLPPHTILVILEATSYLDISSLVQRLCDHVVNSFSTLSQDELRQAYSIVNDFTPEELAQIQNHVQSVNGLRRAGPQHISPDSNISEWGKRCIQL